MAPSTPAGSAPGNDGPALSPLDPASMHRSEDDAVAADTSPEFNERPRAAGQHTAPAATVEPASRSSQPTTSKRRS